MKHLHCTLFALACCLPAQDQDVAPAVAQPAKGPGKPHFWMTIYPGQIVKFDTDTDKVLHRISLQHGMPWGVTLTHDKQRFLVVTDQQRKIEVVDRAHGAVTSVHDFAEKDVIVRVQQVEELPGGRQWYVRTDRIKKLPDQFAFEPSVTLLYDPAEQKVVKKLRDLPRILEGQGRRTVSPDGTRWFVNTREGDIRIIDPDKLKEEAKIDLTTPLYTGMGRIRPMGDDLDGGSNPDGYRVLYTMTDPVQTRRTLWGIAEVSIKDRRLVNVTEFGASPGFFGYRVAKNGKRAVAAGSVASGGLSPGSGGTGYDRQSRLALFDLENGKKLVEAFVEFRPRQMLSAISPDGRKVYVGGAGSDFQVYDEQLKFLHTVEMPGEIYGGIHVLDDPR